MHETAVVAGLMDILKARAEAHGVGRITVVRLKIGRLRGLDSRQIRGMFEIMAEGTPAEGARLDIDEVAVTAVCGDCARTFEVQRYRFECPDCGGSEAEVVTGRELHIESFDTDVAPALSPSLEATAGASSNPPLETP